jgi:hypothetical protein
MSDPAYNDMAPRHYRTRAVGQLWLGPLQANGYDNRVMNVTMSDVEFKNSVEAARFMNMMRRKYNSQRGLIRSHRMKFASIGSD